MIVRQTNGLRLKTELVDKINPTKNRYKERPIFDLVSFSNEKIEEYVYLTVVTTGDRNGSPILVYQVNGPVVTLEKVTDFVYRYKDPEDEIYTERLFEAEVIIDNLESKKKQAKVVSDPSVYYLTSQIYPINLIEEAYTSSKGISGRILTSSDLRLFQSIFEESFTSVSRITGIFKQSLFLYNYKDTDNNTYEPLRLNINRVSGVLRQLLLTYSTVPENLKTSLVRVTGVLRQLLINYTYYIPENLKSNINRLDGTSFSFSPYHQIFISGNSLDYNPNDSDNGVTILQKTATTSQSTNDLGIPYKSYNTSVLDFENGLLDRKNSNVIWNKSGTADVTTTNKLYGTTSFETKGLDDSLYTNSNIITGGSTPFTIEFYLLLTPENINVLYNIPIFCSTIDNENYKAISRSITTGQVFTSGNTLNVSDDVIRSKSKFNLNEINKITMSYDGSAFRLFINDILEIIKGTLTGYFTKGTNPYYFLKELSGYTRNSFGLIDNINIFDGIATKVRDTDPYEENLIIDLAFDGENNSTKIVDNGSLKSNWLVNGNAKISTAQPFDGYSSLSLDNTSSYIQTNLTTTLIKNFTISFNYRTTDLTTASAIFDARSSVGQYNGFLITHPSSDPTSLQIYLNGNGTGWDVSLNSGSFLSSNTNYKIDIVCNNNSLSFYINGVLRTTQQYSTDISIILNNRLVSLGRNTTGGGGNKLGYFKNFKIYKDVAIFPENRSGKIQLDFDNNVVDKYGNSTWTNNSVTFDQVNSVKGYSAYFNGSSTSYTSSNTNNNLNFSVDNFSICMDIKPIDGRGTYAEILTPNLSSWANGACTIGCFNSGWLRPAIYHNNADIGLGGLIVLNNIYYNLKFARKTNTSMFFVNDSIVDIKNLLAFGGGNPAFNFANNGTNIGRATWHGSGNVGYKGYLDNFKTYKEDLLKNNDITIFTDPTVTINYKILDECIYVTGSGATSSSNGTSIIRLNDSPSLKNFTAEIELYFDATNMYMYGGLIFRTIEYKFRTPQLGYLIYFTVSGGKTHLRFGKGSNSSSDLWTMIHTIDVDSYRNNTYRTLKVIAKDNNFKAYIDDTLIFDVIDNSHNISSQFGMNSINYFNAAMYSKTKRVNIWDENGNDVYYKDWESKIDYVVDKPAVHLPLETNATNIGFSGLTINSVGSPTYTTVDGKKCIKFESGKYLTINTNNIFNLGTNSDFYIEFDVNLISFLTYNMILTNNNNWTTSSQSIWITNQGKIYIQDYSIGTIYESLASVQLNTWNKIIIARKNDIIKVTINNTVETVNKNFNFNLSVNNCYIGCSGWATSTDRLNGYMSNFKMFVGTSEIPETYNDKKVLDLDFKPTRKSYLFKDNNNKCIIHPINISYRDYLDSRYCCSFNGTNQYIQLGKNDLFNFGSDDFLINIKFKVNSLSNNWGTLLAGGGTSGVNNNNKYAISINSDGTLRYNYNGSFWKTAASVISTNNIYDLAITRKDFVIKVYLNGVLLSFSNEGSAPLSQNINFNFNNNTIIGANLWDGSAGYFNGVIYSIKSFRNTSDISLLNNTILSTPSNIYLPLQKDLVDIKSGTAWTATPSITYVNNAALINLNDSTKISTGANSNLNFGTGDFTIGIDSFKTTTATDSRLVATNATSTDNYPRAEIKQTSTYGVSLTNYPTSSIEVRYKDTKSGDVMSNWFTSKFSKTNNTIFTYVNDSLVDINTCGNGHSFNFNYNNGTTLGGVHYNTLVSNRFGGYLNNFYSNNVAELPVVFPYLYLPYDTTLQDQGVNALSFGSPTTYASLDTVSSIKCARISSSTTNPQYSGIILGTVFSIEANLYIPAKASVGYNIALFGTGVTTNIGFLLTQFTEPWSGNAIPHLLLRTSGTDVSFDISSLIGTWIKVKVIKTLTNLTLYVNNNNVGTIDSTNWNNSDFESSRIFYIGDGGSNWKESKTFYINNFRYYKGLVDIPTSENLSKKVLHMKFKKNENTVYFLKDDSRKQVLSSPTLTKYDLVNIENIDCLQFNGSNSVIEIAQNKNLNLLDDDFVISFKWYYIPYVNPGTSQWQVIIGNGTTNSTSNLSYIAYSQDESAIVVRCKDTEVFRVSNQIKAYAWNTVILKRTDKVFNLTINEFSVDSAVSTTDPFNLNFNNITYIGVGKWNNSNEYLKGYLSNLQIYKGTSDTTLLDTEVTETVIIENPPKNIYYPLVLNKLDSFNNMWVQTNSTNPVRLKEFTKGLGTSMYFDGVSGLYSTNYFNRIGLNPFTIECGIKIDSVINSTYHMTILCYGITYNREEWFSLEVTSAGAIRFIPDRSNLNSFITSSNSVINYNTNYNIAITRDSNYILRIFVNGVKVAEGTVNTCFDSYSQNSGGSYLNSSNYLVLGKRPDYWNSTDSTRGGFKGNIENFHYLVGTCKYTGDYVVTVDDTVKLETKSLLNVDNTTPSSPSSLLDTFNNITYTNTGCTVEQLNGQLRPYSIRCQTNSNRLVSNVSESMFNLGYSNWTIDLIFKPMQTAAEAYLLDTRANSTIFRGLVIRQPETNPTTIRVEIGSSNASSAFENTYQSAANTLVANTTYHLRLVRCRENILIFLNGTLLNTISYGLKDIGYCDKIILFNNDLYNKGFNGYLTQFRYIKGISTNVIAFTQLTEELT